MLHSFLTRLISHKRFPLFAPFIGLATLTVIAFLFWGFAADRLAHQVTRSGITWQHMERHGFPARISLTFDKLHWRDGNRLWQNQQASLTTMPFNARHAIIDFHGRHDLRLGDSQFELTHQGHLMSVVGGENGLLRASSEVQSPVLTGLWDGQSISAKSDAMSVHMRSRADRHELAVAFTNIISTKTEKPIDRLEVTGSAPARFVTHGPAIGQMLTLDRLTWTQDGVTIIARGRVKLRAEGRIDGTVDVDIVNLGSFIDMLIETGFAKPAQRQKLLFFGGLGAALGGDTQDRLSVPLTFKQGRIRLGPVDLGAAPVWQ